MEGRETPIDDRSFLIGPPDVDPPLLEPCQYISMGVAIGILRPAGDDRFLGGHLIEEGF